MEEQGQELQDSPSFDLTFISEVQLDDRIASQKDGPEASNVLDKDELSNASSVTAERRRRRVMLIFITAMVVIILLCSLLVTRNRRDEHDYTRDISDKDSQKSIAIEDFSENQIVQDKEENDTYEYQVLAPKVEDPSKLLDPDAPQGKAFLQIVEEEWGQTPGDTFRLIQRFALITLFMATTGKNNVWDYDYGWQGFLDDECSWIGCRTCRLQKSYGQSAVTNLDLTGNNLIGVLPSEICLLSGLEILKLSSNRLKGPIPSCIAEKLNSLIELELQNNDFSGLQDGETVERDLSNLCNQNPELDVTADCKGKLVCDCCECPDNKNG